jgi:hypothetical protein
VGSFRNAQTKGASTWWQEECKARGAIHHHYVVVLQEQMNDKEPYLLSFCYGLVGRKNNEKQLRCSPSFCYGLASEIKQ